MFTFDDPDFTSLKQDLVNELRPGQRNLEDLRDFTLEETVFKKSHAKVALDALIEDTIVEQIATGRSAAEKVYRLTNDGAPTAQQVALF